MMSQEVTKEAIDNAIKSCKWCEASFGIDMCVGMCGPCAKVIMNGDCPTLKDLVKEEEE